MARNISHRGVVTCGPKSWFCPRHEHRASRDGFSNSKPGRQAAGRRGAENTFRVADDRSGVLRYAIVPQEEHFPSIPHKQLRRSYDVNPPGHCIAPRLATLGSILRPWSTNRSQCSVTSSETTATLSVSHALSIGCDIHRCHFRITCTSNTAVLAHALHVERRLQATTRFQCIFVSVWSDAAQTHVSC